MGDCTISKNKAEFETTAQTFLDKILTPVLKNNLNVILFYPPNPIHEPFLH